MKKFALFLSAMVATHSLPAFSTSSYNSNYGPYCGRLNLGEIYYDRYEDELKACKTTGWTAVSVVGPRGPRGLQGIQGPDGQEGPIGPQGLRGAKGDKGDAGAQGPVGLPGVAGAKGDTGAQGPVGLQGVAGAKGEQGIKGDTGAQGPEGLPGVAGAKGDKGEQGIKGDTGAQGPEGLPGVAGAKGDKGEQGIKGDTGAQGIKGDTGAQGPEGLPGVAGAKGDKGEQGIKGDTGAQGPVGLPGVAGAKGDKGEQGIKGDTGEQGPVGLPGVAGAKGDKGERGDTGLQGPAGNDAPNYSAGANLELQGSVLSLSESISVQEVKISGTVQVGDGSQASCSSANEGALRFNSSTKNFEGCDGTSWKGLSYIPPTPKRMFVSSATYAGSSLTVPIADQECLNMASGASLGGSWKAWFSTPNSSVNSRFTNSTVPYVNMQGQTVASSWSDLVDGSIQNAIRFTEHKVDISASSTSLYATGTSADGNFSGFSCPIQGAVTSGHASSTTSTWSNLRIDSCSVALRLLCVEQ